MQNIFMKIIKSTKVQLAAIVIATCYIALLLAYQHKTSVYLEKAPELLQVKDNIKKLANPVTVGIHINSFQDFSFSSNNFTIDAIVWFRFVQTTESLDTLNKFTIQNSMLLGDGSLIYKSPPIIKIFDKEVLVAYYITVTFMASLNHKDFPADKHKLCFILQNKSVTARELIFVTDNKNISLSKDILVSNWRPTGASASAGCFKAQLDQKDSRMNITYPCVAFSVDFEDIGARVPISLYFPLFLLFFIILISLTLSISDSNRLTLVSGGAPAIVLFRLVIDSVAPRVGYITRIDMAYYLVVSLSIIILLLQAYMVLVLKKRDLLSEYAKQKLYERLENINAIMFVAIILFLVLFLTIYVFF